MLPRETRDGIWEHATAIENLLKDLENKHGTSN